MATTQQILQATADLQQNAQAALPIIPNNGNPAGAYNMPPAVTPQTATPAGPDLSWLQPSTHMAELSTLLKDRQARLNAMSQQMIPQVQQIPPMGGNPQNPVLPVLPMMR